MTIRFANTNAQFVCYINIRAKLNKASIQIALCQPISIYLLLGCQSHLIFNKQAFSALHNARYKGPSEFVIFHYDCTFYEDSFVISVE